MMSSSGEKTTILEKRRENDGQSEFDNGRSEGALGE